LTHKVNQTVSVLTIFFIFIGVALFSSCKTIDQRKAVKDCKFGLENVSIEGISLQDVHLRVDLITANPNDIKVIVDRFDYSLFVEDDILVSTGEHKEKIEIEPQQKGRLEIDMIINSQEVGKALLASILAGDAQFLLVGTIHIETWIGTIDYPLEMEFNLQDF